MCFIFDHCTEEIEYWRVQIEIICHELLPDGAFFFKMAAKISKFTTLYNDLIIIKRNRNGNDLTNTIYDQFDHIDITTLSIAKTRSDNSRRGCEGGE